MIPTCAHCPTPLSDRQGVYCSVTCRRAALAVPERLCAGCGAAFRGYQHALRYCSKSCFDQHRPRRDRPLRQRLLDVLRANGHTWVVTRDLALALYGDDGAWECAAVRTLLHRLRRFDGVEIASRPAGGPSRAYRLIARQEVAA